MSIASGIHDQSPDPVLAGHLPATVPAADPRPCEASATKRERASWLLPLALAQLVLIGGCTERTGLVEPVVPDAANMLLVPAVGFAQVSAGNTHTCALRDDGIVECWGGNSQGQAPATKAAVSGSFTQVSTGDSHTCGLRGDGVVECWGRNVEGQAPAIRVAISTAFTQVSAGLNHTCGLRSDAVVECWGFNLFGQAPATKTAASGTFTQVSAGAFHTCALRVGGVVECWGRNVEGQAPATRTPGSSVFTQLDAGYFFTCALRGDGVVECWGFNSDGQAPASQTAASSAFAQVSAGTNLTCALRSDGAVECWGHHADGQTHTTRTAAIGAFAQVTVGERHGCAVRSDGVVECWEYNGNGQAPPVKTSSSTTRVVPTAAFSATPASVLAGEAFTLALTNAQVPGHPEATQFTYAFDCGDGSGYGAFGPSDSASCPTGASGTRTVKGTVRDQDNDVTEYTGTVEVTPSADTTPPVITPTVSGTLGSNGWYTSAVTMTWTVSDAESPVTSPTCSATTISVDTPGQTVTCSATSAGGTTSNSLTLKRDATSPTLTPMVSPSPVLLNGSATASPHASDATSGLASASCGALDTGAAGSKSVTCTATDQAGNTASAQATYNVYYAFVGFASPVDNDGVLNAAKAGQPIPLKWRLLDADGSAVTTLNSVTVTVASLTCAVESSANALEEYAAGNSGLQNLGDGYYQFNWKTPRSYRDSCKTLHLNLGEGTTRIALFQFK